MQAMALEVCRPPQRAQRGEARRRRCGHRRRRARRVTGRGGDQRRDRDPLVDRDVRPDLQHLAAAVRRPGPATRPRSRSRWRATRPPPRSSAPRQCSATIAPLSSTRIPARSSSPPSSPATNAAASCSWPSREGSGRGSSSPGQQQLEAVVARVGDLLEPDEPPRVRRPPAADHGDQRVAVGEPAGAARGRARAPRRPRAAATIGARVPSTSVRTAARLWVARAAGASSRAELRRLRGFVHGTSIARRADGPFSWSRSGPPPAPSAASSASAAGPIIVPLLILWLAYGEREATGTSMAAIIVIAALRGGRCRRPTATSTRQGRHRRGPGDRRGASPAPRSSSGSPSARSPACSPCCWS